ncbi:hypothetical protein PFDG_03710 [Plasmodium falciparum Dd2]|uniref:Rifin n=1 Tax=Plasmodium falciparum (isolate Dd2) TaxID=57267 RepID=A0A0L7M4L8_PLAF4|nr:hypothetical protein PFDG_03710 [Plasmodium falciparum Dd2]
MKLHYPKILFFIPLNILITSSSYEYNKNKPYIKPHTPTTTSRVLSECGIQTSIYDNDPEMRSVKENFNRHTSERFEEYDERMNDKRRKRCGVYCWVWSVVYGMPHGKIMCRCATKAATKAGIAKAIEGLGDIFGLEELTAIDWPKMIHAGNYSDKMSLIDIMNTINIMCGDGQAPGESLFCTASSGYTGRDAVFTTAISKKAVGVAVDAGEAARFAEAKEAASFLPKTIMLSNNIVASIVAIVVIVLVMFIIYLILRYRRKKKMKKKQQYTKLLKE